MVIGVQSVRLGPLPVSKVLPARTRKQYVVDGCRLPMVALVLALAATVHAVWLIHRKRRAAQAT